MHITTSYVELDGLTNLINKFEKLISKQGRSTRNSTLFEKVALRYGASANYIKGDNKFLINIINGVRFIAHAPNIICIWYNH